MNAKTVKNTATVRERLLDSADRLFYQEGYRAVGIDRVLAEAGAAKASLYSHFGSKDELVTACIARRTSQAKEQMLAFIEAVPPEQRALRLFDFLIAWGNQAEFRGCPIQHLVSEFPDTQHPARQVAQAHRAWILEKLEEWCQAAAVAEPAQTASALLVLFDGAILASEQDGVQRAHDAKWCAAQLLAN